MRKTKFWDYCWTSLLASKTSSFLHNSDFFHAFKPWDFRLSRKLLQNFLLNLNVWLFGAFLNQTNRDYSFLNHPPPSHSLEIYRNKIIKTYTHLFFSILSDFILFGLNNA